MLLKDWLPTEALGYEYTKDRHFRYLDLEVVKEFTVVQEKDFISWPGTHNNVLHWVILENGMCVGWNESSSRGWSFPVLSKKTGKKILEKV